MDDITVVIPARLQSTRLPLKPLININGLPLIIQTIRAAYRLNAPIIVTTDSELIAKCVREHYLDVTIHMSGDCKNGTDRIYQCVRDLSLSNNYIVNWQCDEPFLIHTDVESIMSMLSKVRTTFQHAVAGTLAYEISSDFDRYVKVVVDKSNKALYFSRSHIPFGSTNILAHVGVYVFKPLFFDFYKDMKAGVIKSNSRFSSENLEQLLWLEYGVNIYCSIINGKPPIGINTREDLEIVSCI